MVGYNQHSEGDNMAIPLTDFEVVCRTAVHPLVVKYRKAFQGYREQMERSYGPDFAEEYTPKDATEMDLDPRGFSVMTERESSHYKALYIRMQAVRNLVKEHIRNH